LAGRNDFSTLLDRAPPPAPQRRGVPPIAFFDYLPLVDELRASATPVASGFAAAQYESAYDLAPGDPLPHQEEPASPPSTDPGDIAAELDLAGLDATEVAAARRRFASLNHPDRVAPMLRVNALVRMQIANALVDEAEHRLAGRKAGAPPGVPV
jgi:hypothetical protein